MRAGWLALLLGGNWAQAQDIPVRVRIVGGSVAVEAAAGGSIFQTSGPVPCESGSCSVTCSGGTCSTGGSVFDNLSGGASGNVSGGGRGFSASFSGDIASDGIEASIVNGGAGIHNLRVKVFAAIPQNATILARTAVSLDITWKNRRGIGGASAGVGSRCGGVGVQSDSSLNGGRSRSETLSCELTPTNESIVEDGVTFFLVEEIAATASAGVDDAGVKGAKSSSFEGSVSFDFRLKGKTLEKFSEPSQPFIVTRQLPEALVARVLEDEDAQRPVAGTIVAFSTSSTPEGGSDASVDPPSDTTDGEGLAETFLTFGKTAGTYQVRAFCADCVAPLNQVEFSAVAVTTESVTELREIFCDGTGFFEERLEYDLQVQAVNRLDGLPVEGIDVVFTITQEPGGTSFVSGGQTAVSTTDEEGVARTSLQLGPQKDEEKEAITVEASCAKCEANPTVICPVEVTVPPQHRNPVPPIGPIQQGGNEGGAAGITLSVIPNVVAPAGTGPSVGQPEVADVEIRGSSGTEFVARIWPINHTGGHQHAENRPSGIFTESGTSEFFGKIPSGGIETLVYRAPEVGGEEVVEVELADGSLVRTFIFVRVQNLRRLSGSNHVAVSGDGQHPIFTYGTQSLIDTINFVADAYFLNVTSSTLKISVNDMSLISGGAFDICGKWDTKQKCLRSVGGKLVEVSGHISHQTGKDVDLNSLPRDVGTGEAISPNTKEAKEFVSKIQPLFEARGCNKIPEEPIHFRCP